MLLNAASALDMAITRIAHSDDAPAATPVPEPTYGPGNLTGAEIDRRMAAFGR